jgi:hypothetical protein
MHGIGRQKARRSAGNSRQVARRWRQTTISLNLLIATSLIAATREV